MKTLYFKKATGSGFEKCRVFLMTCISLFYFTVIVPSVAYSQTVLFDFNSAPLYTPLPIDLSMGGVRAHFSATGQGYSIQNANTMGFTPAGFDGYCIYPSSINLSDLLVSFDQTLTDFSIMYSCQELGCDDAATMRVTAKMNDSIVGTNTKTARYPGTWPVDTLRCSFPQGFNSVVIHYDSPPPTCRDYGVIFLADNMQVTVANLTAILDSKKYMAGSIFPNPVSKYADISFSLFQSGNIHITIYDIERKFIKEIFNGILNKGEHQVNWNANDIEINNGVYLLNIAGENFSQSYKVVLLK